MMATTHALAGVALATVALVLAPEHAPVAVAAAAAGGVFPDLDLLGVHRRHLHYPFYYPVLAAVAALLAAVWTTPATVALVAFLAAAALHSLMDAFGGGLELEPWRGESDRAVYDHRRSRWIAPRRWIRYDGAPEDLLLAALLAIPPLLLFDGYVDWFVLATLGVSAGYVLVRKRLVTAWLAFQEALPPDVRRRIPEQFLEE